ncbi:MAG: citrate lyase acyl carrier protein [Fusobacterium sp.]|nr:citrate lyase acyl carrier protein [Fusobacterium sp.]
MRLKKPAKCGTLESNDIFVILTPAESGIEIELESTVEKQFGAHMREVIKNKLIEMGVEGVKVQAQDKGALDFTIRARIEAAVARAL